jgi:hypothetical protein
MSKKRKTRVKFYKFLGLKCQGRKELKFLKECVRYKKQLPTKPERVKTPYTYYTPDFEYEDRYIEIKSKHTLDVSRGIKAYKGLGTASDLQWTKICWVAKNIKPIEIIVYLKRREKIPILNVIEENITIKFKGGYKPKIKIKPNKKKK